MRYHPLDPEERFYIWQEFKDAVSNLFYDIDDKLYYRFAPCNKPEDKDVANVQKLRDDLYSLYEFTEAHLQELDKEYTDFDTERSNIQLYHNAWEYGLCPKVLKEYEMTFGGDMYYIAKFKQSKTISQEDTRHAIELWQAEKIKKEKRVHV